MMDDRPSRKGRFLEFWKLIILTISEVYGEFISTWISLCNRYNCINGNGMTSLWTPIFGSLDACVPTH